MRSRRRFELARPKGKDDNVGTVRLVVRLATPNNSSVPGNVMRAMTVRNAKVSEVADAIREALDGGDP